jgi:hypothetical protein
MTYTNIEKANLIFWVTDIHKSFLTTHEVNEYNKLKNYLKNIQATTGKLYDIAIILSKCDQKEKSDKNKNYDEIVVLNSQFHPDEIVDSDEDTDIYDLVIQVKKNFPEENENKDIILFNAYGRSYYSEKSSSVFKKFAKKQCGNPTKNNINFSISKFYKNFPQRKDEEMQKFFTKCFERFISCEVDVSIMYDTFDKMNIEHQKSMLLSLIGKKEQTYKYYEFLMFVYNSNLPLCQILGDDMFECLFLYNCNIMNRGEYSKNINFVDEYNYINIRKLITTLYNYLTLKKKTIINDNMIFHGDVLLSYEMRKDFLIDNLVILCSSDFCRKINNFIEKTSDKNTFLNMTRVLILYIKSQIKQHTYMYATYEKIQVCKEDGNGMEPRIKFLTQKSVENIYKTMVKKYEDELNDNLVLLTKLEILDKLYSSEITENNIKFKPTDFTFSTIKFNGNLFDAFLKSDEYLEILNIFLDKVFSNEFVCRNKTDEYVLLSKNELLYDA